MTISKSSYLRVLAGRRVSRNERLPKLLDPIVESRLLFHLYNNFPSPSCHLPLLILLLYPALPFHPPALSDGQFPVPILQQTSPFSTDPLSAAITKISRQHPFFDHNSFLCRKHLRSATFESPQLILELLLPVRTPFLKA